jgi:hypothetical protein
MLLKMRTVMIVASLVCVAPEALGQAFPGALTPFTSRCTETASTGFSWIDGAWAQKTFTPRTFILSKMQPPADPAAETLCVANMRRADSIMDSGTGLGMAGVEGCFSFTQEGQQPIGNWCDEEWVRENGAWRLSSIHCDNLGPVVTAQPDGIFVYQSAPANASVPASVAVRKDSLILSHGRCAPQG